jgi:hypothetical protein
MTRRSDSKLRKQPQYLRHSRWNTAYLYVREAEGKRRQIPLGKYDSPASWKKFHEIAGKVAMGESIAEFLPGGDEPNPEESPPASVKEICAILENNANDPERVVELLQPAGMLRKNEQPVQRDRPGGLAGPGLDKG